mmetsp:Transcript_9353/g.9697  ORF Transcript_9353/g.9697 Transcript_9353/m.9697 type:complete len:98 (-) Transcript_9353:237-530(-)
MFIQTESSVPKNSQLENNHSEETITLYTIKKEKNYFVPTGNHLTKKEILKDYHALFTFMEIVQAEQNVSQKPDTFFTWDSLCLVLIFQVVAEVMEIM